MKWVLRILVVVVLVVIVAAVALYFTLNGLLRSAVESAGTQAAGVPTRLESVTLRPFAGTLDLSGFALRNPEGFGDGAIFSLADADLAVDTGSLLGDEVVVERLHIDGAELNVVYENGQLNLQPLLDKLRQQQGRKTSDPGASDKAVVIRDLRITNTKLTGSLQLTPGAEPVAVNAVIPEIALTDVGGPDTPLSAVLADVLTDIFGAGVSQLVNVQGLDALKGQLGEMANQQLDAVRGRIDEATGDLNQRVDQAVNENVDRARNALGGLLGGQQPAEEPAEEEQNR